MKKRIMAALLCLSLLTGTFAAAAYAGEVKADNLDTTTGDGYEVFNPDADPGYSKDDIDIYAQTIDSSALTVEHVYKVEIVWGDMAFAWGSEEKITRKWEPTNHTYSNNENTRPEDWYIINKAEGLPLNFDSEGAYTDVVEGITQNYVLMFNHSSQPVNANVSIAQVNAGAEGAADDNITATLTPDNGFGVDGTENTTVGGYDYALGYDTEEGVLYSKDNGTAGAAYVNLAGKPTEGALNETTNTTVAKITVKLTAAPENADDATGGDEAGGA